MSTSDALGRVDAHVSHNEFGLEVIEHVLVDLAARREVGEVVGQPAVAAIDPGAQPLDKALPWRRAFLFCQHRYSETELHRP
jgi:hypothetical protein